MIRHDLYRVLKVEPGARVRDTQVSMSLPFAGLPWTTRLLLAADALALRTRDEGVNRLAL